MPQPDSSRSHIWSPAQPAWPIDPEAPVRLDGRREASPATRPRVPQRPEQDARTPDDKDGNQELEREERDEPEPPSRRTRSGTASLGAQRGRDIETEDTGEWVATQRFTLDEELDDTWPNVPPRYLDD